MSVFIYNYSTIGRNVIDNAILPNLSEPNHEVVAPNFKEVIPAKASRRMSSIIKMGVYTALHCIGDETVNGIIHGTGLGCISDTEKFLSQVADEEKTILSPTPFIQSTHNTIAGQIALLKKIQAYNMTHVQGGVSFECALMDGIALVNEDQQKVMVGCTDESTEFLMQLMNEFKLPESDFSYGGSSFLIGSEAEGAKAELESCEVVDYASWDAGSLEADVVVSGSSYFNSNSVASHLDYSKFSGVHLSNSGYGLQLAIELLHASTETLKTIGISTPPKSIAVVNNYKNEKIGIVNLKAL